MADLGISIDTSDEKLNQSIELIQPGVYEACVSESSVHKSKNGTGSFLKLMFVLNDHRFSGIPAYDNIVIAHDTSKKAVEYGQRKLIKICKCISYVGALRETRALHGKPMLIKVGIKPAENGYSESNCIDDYLPLPQAQSPYTQQNYQHQ